MGTWKEDATPPQHQNTTKGKQVKKESSDHQQWDDITELKLTGGGFKPSEQNSVIKNVVKATIQSGFILVLTENAWPEYTNRATLVRMLLVKGAAVVGATADPVAARLRGEDQYASFFTEKVHHPLSFFCIPISRGL